MRCLQNCYNFYQEPTEILLSILYSQRTKQYLQLFKNSINIFITNKFQII